MTTPYTSSQASATIKSQDITINALLSGYKWGGSTGSGATVSFSFPWSNRSSAVFSGPNGSAYSSNGEAFATYYFGLNSIEQTAAINALQAWANVASINFLQTADNATTVGDIRFAFTSTSKITNEWGYANYPNSYYPNAGDVWINYKYDADTNWSAGTYNFEALMHEIGHTLGLKHPGNYDAGGSLPSPPYVPSNLDNRTETIMSYNNVNSLYVSVSKNASGAYSWASRTINPETPMVLDIQAIQYIYGANNTYHNGDDVYTFDASSPFLKAIWDAGGNDTISIANFKTNCTVDLRPGHYSTIAILSDKTTGINWTTAPPVPTYDNTPNLGIAYDCIIENVIGGSGNDTIYQNQANNNIDGGYGVDTVYYSGNKSNYIITSLSQGFMIKDTRSGSPDGTDTLTNIEFVSFSDQTAPLNQSQISNNVPLTPVISTFVTQITNNKQPIIIGSTSANNSISLFDGTKLIATTTAANDGNFNIAPTTGLSDGSHTLTVSATDSLGHVSSLSNSLVITVNTKSSASGNYANASIYYSIIFNNSSVQLSDHTGLNNVDTYSNPLTIKFSDNITFDTTMLSKTAVLQHSQITNLVELYVASFNRAPDSVGLDYWGSRLSDGMSLKDIAKSFFVQPETVAAYPSNMPTSDFVTKVYNNVLSRGPDSGGLNYWVGELNNGHVTKDSFLLAIINGAMAPTGSAVDRQTLANKEAVGEHYAIYQGLNNSTAWSKDVMAGVTDQMASVTAANAKADGYAAIAVNPATSDLVVKLVGVAV